MNTGNSSQTGWCHHFPVALSLTYLLLMMEQKQKVYAFWQSYWVTIAHLLLIRQTPILQCCQIFIHTPTNRPCCHCCPANCVQDSMGWGSQTGPSSHHMASQADANYSSSMPWKGQPGSQRRSSQAWPHTQASQGPHPLGAPPGGQSKVTCGNVFSCFVCL